MIKRLFFSAFVAALAVAMVSAQQSTVTIPVTKTHADNGKQMFTNYCAPCHGVDGRGSGPTSAALKVQPTNLTLLSKNNEGAYPARHVMAILQFGVQNGSAHGSKEMPVWGPVLGKLDHPMGSSDTQALRINNIVRYVQTMQAK